MKTLLKVLGTVVKVVGVSAGFIPLIAPALSGPAQKTVGSIADKLQQALNVIITTEQTFAASGTAPTGPDKLRAATPFVAQLIQQTDLLIGKHPKDESKFADAATRLTSALADILNSYGD